MVTIRQSTENYFGGKLFLNIPGSATRLFNISLTFTIQTLR